MSPPAQMSPQRIVGVVERYHLSPRDERWNEGMGRGTSPLRWLLRNCVMWLLPSLPVYVERRCVPVNDMFGESVAMRERGCSQRMQCEIMREM